MGRNRTELALMRDVAEECSLPLGEVSRAICSFFSVIVSDADSLPFDSNRKIYTKDAFNSVVSVTHLPSIGRIGPVYSRYLKWRANESSNVSMVPRSSRRKRMTQGDIENIAEDILSGRTPCFVSKKSSEMYDRIWLVGQDGKKSARQVIVKEQKNV